jgi:hypothetical protein
MLDMRKVVSEDKPEPEISPAFYRIFDTLILSPLFARGGLGGMPFALPTI